MARRAAMICGLVAVIIVIACGGGSTPPATHKKASAELQAERLETLEKLKSQGVIDKVEGGGMMAVWVGRNFAGLTFDQKQTFVSVAYAYLLEVDPADPPLATESPTPAVSLMDSNGKMIGIYGPRYGGLQMD